MLRARPAIVDKTGDEWRIRDTLEAVWPLPQRNSPVLLHGDFWPGNILWKDGQLVGIIDWEDAALGDPLADVANSRLEVLWAFGIDAMQSFTRQYQAMTTIDFINLPYGISAPLCDRLPNLPSGAPTTPPKKPCEKDTGGLSPRHSKSYPFSKEEPPRFT